MAASTVTSRAIPNAGIAAAFTNGEQAISASAGVVGTIHFALPIFLTGGVYRLKVASSAPSSAWAGSSTSSLRRVAVMAPLTTVESDFYLRQGEQRLSVILSANAIDSWFTLSLWKDAAPVYVATATNWRSDTTPLRDSDLPSLGDERLLLPVWTVSPNWAGGVLERLTFNTEIMTSETNEEQRRSRLLHPFRSWEATFLRSDLVRMRLDNFSAGVGSQRFLAPFWPDQFRSRLSGLASASITITLPPGTLYQREVFEGALLLLESGDPAVYEVVTVADVTSAVNQDTITLAAATRLTWQAGYRITPLYECRLTQMPTLTVHTDRTASLSCRFDTVGTIKHIEPSWGYCAPLWRYKVNRATPLTMDYERLVFSLDTGMGPADVVDTSGDTRVSVKANATLFGRESLTAYRAFLVQARGRSQRFWFPSGTHDMQPVGTISGLNGVFRGTGYSDWITQPQSSRTMLAFVFKDDTPTVYRRIVGVEKLLSGNDRFTFDRPVGSISADQLLRVSYVLPVRFDQDTFELSHVTDEARAVQVAVVVKSAEIDGLPDIECSVTSRPYPVIESDEVFVSGRITGGSLGGIPPQVESMSVSSALTGGTLQTLLRTASGDTDNLSVGSALTGGTLVSVLKSFDAGVESLSVGAAVNGGSLTKLLINTSLDTDSLSVGAAITGGTLV